MNIIDLVIILFVLLTAVTGWKNGFIRTVVSAVGFVLVFVLAFLLKNPIAEWLSLNLPFFDFGGDFKGVTMINVVLYQVIAFFVVFLVLMSIFAIIVKISRFLEKILKMTIIFGLPSKILGFVVGTVEGVVVTTAVLMLLSLPVFGFDLVHESRLRAFLFESTPGISGMMGNTSQAVGEIMSLRDEFSSNSTKDKFNERTLDIMLKYNVIKTDYTKKLLDTGKLKMNINNANAIIRNYE